MKKLSAFMFINALLCLAYSFFSLSFHADVSLVAFPICLIYTGLVIYFTIIELLRKKSIKHLTAIREVVTYEPFVFITTFIIQRAGTYAMSFQKDLVCAILWVLCLVFTIIIKNRFLHEKRIYNLNEDWKKYREEHPLKKPRGAKRILFEVAETVDAIIWAVFVIALVNIFFVQLYRIPSESMVPTFLINDRAIVWKTAAGPKFPLSEVGLPQIQKYERGDVVVFRNPHYSDDRKSEVKNYLSNFLYMVSFTLIKSNKDENGEVKADPLVKRIVGMPGEQLMLMDGTLYSRTKDSPEFKKVSEDEKFAAWNLNVLSSQTQKKIQWMPISQEEYQLTLDIEEQRRNLVLKEAASECLALSNRFEEYFEGQQIDESLVSSLIPASDLTLYNLFSMVDKRTQDLVTTDGGFQWFRHFLTDWMENLDLDSLAEDGSVTGASLVGGDLYTDSLFRLNVMAKLIFGNIVVRTLDVMHSDMTLSEMAMDSTRIEYLNKAQDLYTYVLHMDQRNMPLFPANDAQGNPQYLADNSYFMMGDNRYNSLDMRHAYTKWMAPLDANDAYTVIYSTNMKPQAVVSSKILGKANYVVWPVGRTGNIKNKPRM